MTKKRHTLFVVLDFALNGGLKATFFHFDHQFLKETLFWNTVNVFSFITQKNSEENFHLHLYS